MIAFVQDITRARFPFALAALSIGVVGCSSPNSDVVDATSRTSFDEIRRETFRLRCAASPCHDANSPAAALRLTFDEAYTELVSIPSSQRPNVLRVAPGLPDESYLYLKLAGDDSTYDGTRMPSGEEPLPPDELETIREWIIDGAPPP